MLYKAISYYIILRK